MHRASSALPPRRPDADESLRHAGRFRRRCQRPAPRGTPQHTSPSATVCASRCPATGSRDEKAVPPQVAVAATPLIEMLPPMTRGLLTPGYAGEPSGDPSGRRYSVPVPAGGTTGSLCARMCAEGYRPQPRHGSGAIADAASGFGDGRDCHSPQVVSLFSG
ncbi:hypothetical protein ebA2457 [Aromatoleum aromaticum EbN1]|uniref:Uncharacterized protein n=1 Tax=Aromatoleum aromaticum (strain DSM 19018 / LMG 30748 / EbN1) TaxID=76114 RepID=Q5P5A6_AROAE|nr:hypothetical protein ebA2457 [Aromatoleum aromaticum EbN1]